MKYLKMLGLAAVAAMALTAFVGAGSASASVLCTTNVAGECAAGHGAEGKKRLNVGDIIKATSTSATLTNSTSNVTCSHSEVSGKITNAGVIGGTKVTGEITALSFTSCRTLGFIPCTVTTQNLPYHFEVDATGGGNGVLTVKSSGKGAPGANVNCLGVINCTFSENLFSLPITGGNPATVTATKVKLLKVGGECPAEATWDATYTAVGTNTSIFVL